MKIVNGSEIFTPIAIGEPDIDNQESEIQSNFPVRVIDIDFFNCGKEKIFLGETGEHCATFLHLMLDRGQIRNLPTGNYSLYVNILFEMSNGTAREYVVDGPTRSNNCGVKKDDNNYYFPIIKDILNTEHTGQFQFKIYSQAIRPGLEEGVASEAIVALSNKIPYVIKKGITSSGEDIVVPFDKFLLSKSDGIVTPEMYKKQGVPETDDVLIQRALDDSNARLILMPNSKYVITKPLVINNGTSFNRNKNIICLGDIYFTGEAIVNKYKAPEYGNLLPLGNNTEEELADIIAQRIYNGKDALGELDDNDQERNAYTTVYNFATKTYVDFEFPTVAKPNVWEGYSDNISGTPHEGWDGHSSAIVVTKNTRNNYLFFSTIFSDGNGIEFLSIPVQREGAVTDYWPNLQAKEEDHTGVQYINLYFQNILASMGYKQGLEQNKETIKGGVCILMKILDGTNKQGWVNENRIYNGRLSAGAYGIYTYSDYAYKSNYAGDDNEGKRKNRLNHNKIYNLALEPQNEGFRWNIKKLNDSTDTTYIDSDGYEKSKTIKMGGLYRGMYLCEGCDRWAFVNLRYAEKPASDALCFDGMDVADLINTSSNTAPTLEYIKTTYPTEYINASHRNTVGWILETEGIIREISFDCAHYANDKSFLFSNQTTGIIRCPVKNLEDGQFVNGNRVILNGELIEENKQLDFDVGIVNELADYFFNFDYTSLNDGNLQFNIDDSDKWDSMVDSINTIIDNDIIFTRNISSSLINALKPYYYFIKNKTNKYSITIEKLPSDEQEYTMKGISLCQRLVRGNGYHPSKKPYPFILSNTPDIIQNGLYIVLLEVFPESEVAYSTTNAYVVDIITTIKSSTGDVPRVNCTMKIVSQLSDFLNNNKKYGDDTPILFTINNDVTLIENRLKNEYLEGTILDLEDENEEKIITFSGNDVTDSIKEEIVEYIFSNNSWDDLERLPNIGISTYEYYKKMNDPNTNIEDIVLSSNMPPVRIYVKTIRINNISKDSQRINKIEEYTPPTSPQPQE